MKKNFIVLGLILMLGVGNSVSAMPHDRGCCPIGSPIPHCTQVVSHHHPSYGCNRPAVGVSFSTGVLARHNCWYPYYYYDAMNFCPRYIDSPLVFINVGF